MTEPSNRVFFQAVHSGDVELTRKLAEQDPSLLSQGDSECFEYRALNIAVWQNNRTMVDLLLSLGAGIDEADDFEPGPWTPLQHALNYHHLDLAEHLVSCGATIDVHAAAGLPRLELLATMLDENPELIHARGGDGKMPLHFAADPEIAKLLLDRGAEIDAPCLDHHSTPAQWAAEHRPKVARYLTERGAAADLFMAVNSRDKEWVEALLRENPESIRDRIDARRFPPASGKDCTSIYLFCPTMGANATPLHVAASAETPEILDLLLDEGIEVDVRGSYDDATPLHLAAWHGRVQNLEKLLDRGASIDLESGEIHKGSPLSWAIVAGNFAAVQCLLDRGAAVGSGSLETAREGERGDFSGVSKASPQEYTKIHALLASRVSFDSSEDDHDS